MNDALVASTGSPPVKPGGGPVDTPNWLNLDGNPRLLDGTFAAYVTTGHNIGWCTHPIRLRGRSELYDTATGCHIRTYDSTQAPLGELYVRCGNRRAEVCPSCSRLYARDTYAMIHAGIAGGKTIPTTVANNPLLFLTLTAPSFGHVHGTRPHPKTGQPSGGVCLLRKRAAFCEHGMLRSCTTRHTPDDPEVGSPICQQCYDYDTAIVWQWWAPELWRRTTIALRRALATSLGVAERELNTVASLQYAKVAEYQQRGTVHFHALIRLDGPTGPGSPASPLDTDQLAGLVHQAAQTVSYTAPAVDDDDEQRVLAWGRQLDIKKVTSDLVNQNQALTAGQVAGYLAKYSTKDADTRRQHDTAHHRQLRDTCTQLSLRALRHGDPHAPYLLLAKWAHMLGFRGHFTTKSRSYSITLGRLRRARHRYAKHTAANGGHKPLHTTELETQLLTDRHNEETTLVVGDWTYQGSGWPQAQDTQLALQAANQALQYAKQQAAAKHVQTRQEKTNDRN